MAILSPVKALRILQKTPLILNGLLENVTTPQARAARDAEGWSVLEVMCHLRDYERIVNQRVCDTLAKDQPMLAVFTNSELQALGEYSRQHVQPVFHDFVHRRRELIALLEDLREDQWMRLCVHPGQGPGTVLDIAINAGLHDVDHIEQISRCLRELRETRAQHRRAAQAHSHGAFIHTDRRP